MQALAIGKAAQFIGTSVSTLRRWHAEGLLTPDFRTTGNHRRYLLSSLTIFRGENRPAHPGLTVCYARVSCSDQRDDLARQAERLVAHAEAHYGGRCELITDLGSGLNCKKRGLNRLLGLIVSGQVQRLIIENADRLLRFASELIFTLCRCFSVEVVVTDAVGEETFERRLVDDVLAVITVFSARLYGARSHARRKAQQAGEAVCC